MNLRAEPITLRDANLFVKDHHRHSKPKRGCKFTVAAYVGEKLVGVLIAARPDARMLSAALDLSRNCTDGTRNACSFLYARGIGIGKLMGYRRIVTYTREDESGSSLRAVGFMPVATVAVAAWDREARPREETRDLVPRIRWEINT